MKNNNSNNNSNSSKKPKKIGRKIVLPANRKSKSKTKVNVKETVLPPSNYNGGAVFTLDDLKNYNDTTTVSEASTYTTTVDAANNTVITSLPNKEELYSKYTEVEETSTHPNNLVPKANTDGVNTMIIIAGALALLAFIALILS